MSILYDPFSAESRADPFPHYAQLRAEAPVHRLNERLWVISRYADCSSRCARPSSSPPRGRD